MSGATTTTQFHVPPSVTAFLSASAAAGNRTVAVAVKGRTCPLCTGTTLFFEFERSASVMTGRTPRQQFKVTAHCRTSGCSFSSATDGRFTLA